MAANMSTSTNPGLATKGNNVERRGLGKYVKRISTVFRRDRGSKSQAPATAPHAPAASASEGPAQQAQPEQQERPPSPSPPPPPPPPPPQQQQPQPQPQPSPPDQSANDATPTPVVPHVSAPPAPVPLHKTIDRNAMQHERALALFAKYGLTLESHEWMAAPRPTPALERVEKPIRMRVHRSCHRCGTLYGADKTCVQCDHRRCKKCPRFPRKKTPEDKLADKDAADQPKRKRMLTIRTRAGDELVYQPTKQRIRRTCHMCSTVFVPAQATVCHNCQHLRCTKCPRDPAKPNKWPAGYPGDADLDSETEMDRQLETFRRTWRKPRTRVRWQCDKCSSLFQSHSPQCSGCGHERCDQCTRSPVKKPNKTEQFDAQAVAAVEAKLRAMDIDDGPSSAAEAT